MQIVASVTRRQSRNGLSARTGVGSYSARKALLTAAVAVAASLPGARALAQDLSWDVNAGNSNWSTDPGDANWILNGNAGTLWSNSANYGAVFGVDNFGLAVQLPGGITARSVDVQAGGMSFNGTGPLTLVGSGTGAYLPASFTVTNAATATMNVPIITSSRVLTKQGSGTLVLGATNSLIGSTVLNTLRNDAQSYRANLLIGVPITDSSVVGGTVKLSAGTSLSSTDSIGFGFGFLDLNGQTVTVANLRSGNTGQATSAWANATDAKQGVIGGGTIKVLGEITSQVSFNFAPGTFGITSNIDLGAKNQVFRTAFAGGSSIGSSNIVVSGVMSNGGVLTTSGLRGAAVTAAEGVTFIADNTYTGPTIINGGGNVFTGTNQSQSIRVEGGITGFNFAGGNLVLQTATGAFPNATSVLVAAGTSMLLDNATLNGNTSATLPFLSRGSNLNRIGDTATVELRDGRLLFVGPVTATGFETIGSLNISGGLGTIQITPSNTGAGNTAGIQVTGNLTLGANAALKVQTSTTGTGNGTNAVGGNARLLIAGTVPAAVGGILPRIVTASDFTTYNAFTGITPLSSYSSTLTAGSNFTVAAAGSLVASSVNVNSVKGASAISLQPGVVLGVTSGMFMGLGTTTVQGFGTMSFGGTTGAIFGSTVNFNAPVSGTAGLLVSDATLNLNGNMSGLSGTITQNNGTLTINTPTVVAGIALRTGTLNLNVSEPGSGRGAAVIGVAANDGDLAQTAPSLSFSAAGANAVFGRDFVIDNGGRTVAGQYVISGGVALSPLPNAQGSQTFTGNWTINSPVSLTGSGTSGSTAYNGVTRFTGNLSGSSLFAIGANGRVAFDGTYSQTGGFEINAGGGNSAAMYFSGNSVGSQPLNITGNGAFAFSSVTVGYTSDIALPSGPLTLLQGTAYVIPTGNSTRSQAITSYGDLFFAPAAGTTTTLTGTVLTPAVNDGFSSAYTVGLAGPGRLILPADPAINVKVAAFTYFANNASPLVYNNVTVTGTGALDLSGYVGNVTRTAGQVIALENGTVTGGTIDGAGSIIFSASGTATATSFPVVASNLAGNTTVTATGTGTPPVLGASMALTLTGTNTYAGPTKVEVATLRGVDGVNISPNSMVTVSNGVLEGSPTYQRTPGVDLILSGVAGFSARGGPAIVSLGGPSAPQIVFGAAGLNAATGLILNGPTANDTITLKNPVDLGGTTRTFAVYTGSAIAEGVISNGALLKAEVSPRNASGTLVLAATNTYSGDTTVQGLGFLRAVDGVGLPTASKLVLQMGGSIQTSGTFARNYDGAGGVIMPFVPFSGGFTNASAAGFDNLSDTPGSPLTVAIGGVATPTTLQLDAFAGGSFGATTLLFNTSTVANGPVTFANPVNVNGFNASVTYPVGSSTATMLGMQFQVGNGNGAAGVGTVNMTGGIIDNLGNGAFTKTGPGLLVLGATPASWGLINNQGTIAVTGGTLATAPGVGLLAGRVVINGGTFDPTSGGLTNTYSTLDRQIVAVTLNATGSNIVGAVAGTGTLSYGGGTTSITQSVPNNLGGSLNVTVSSTGVTSFSGTNTHSGITHVSGVARFASASAISTSSNLRLANFGTIQTAGTFAPVLGAGAGQFSFNTGATTVGFDAWSTTPGTTLTLNFGGAGATLTAGGTFLARTLNLNAHASLSANGPITFANGLDLNAGNFTFNVGTGSQTGNAGTVTLSGAISGAAASTGTVTKSGNGRLVLTNAGNNWGTATTGLVVVSAGTLAVGPTAGLPKNINLTGGSFDASARVTPFPLASTQTISVQNAASQILGPIGGTGTISFGGTAANLQLASSANIAGSVAVAVTNTATTGFTTTTLTGAISTAAPITVSGNANRLVLQSAPSGTNALNLAGSQVTVDLAAPGSPSVNTVVGTFSSVNFTNGNNAGFSTTNVLRITPTDRTTLKASVLITSAVNNATFTGSFLNGFLDIGNNDMIVKGGAASLTGLRSQVSAWLASKPTGSSWGIGSSLASPASAPFTTVAMASNATAFGFPANTTFDGQAVDATDVLVKYTYVGDTDLNGLLDARDYNAVLNGWTNGLTGWQNGDVDYNGIVDVNDWTLFSNAYAWFTSQMSPTTYGDPSGNGSAVPEPAALALLAPVAALLGRRRRR